MRKDIRNKVFNKMVKNKKTRDNDNLLIAEILKDVYKTTDMREVAKMTNEGICETITRMRRMVQKTNPLVASSKNASKARTRKETEFKKLGKEL